MGGFNQARLKDVSLAISELACDCRIWNSPRYHRKGGCIAFRGSYQLGSAGKNDARWISWRLNEFYELARFDGLVVDCRTLNYTWGDDLWLRPDLEHLPAENPYLLVIRPEQQEAFNYAEPQKYHRFDLLAALAEMDESLRNMKG